MADSAKRRSAYGRAVARMCGVAGTTAANASVGAGFSRDYAAKTPSMGNPPLASLDRIARACGYEVVLANRERRDAFSLSRMLRG
jgi:hypothetical protein